MAVNREITFYELIVSLRAIIKRWLLFIVAVIVISLVIAFLSYRNYTPVYRSTMLIATPVVPNKILWKSVAHLEELRAQGAYDELASELNISSEETTNIRQIRSQSIHVEENDDMVSQGVAGKDDFLEVSVTYTANFEQITTGIKAYLNKITTSFEDNSDSGMIIVTRFVDAKEPINSEYSVFKFYPLLGLLVCTVIIYLIELYRSSARRRKNELSLSEGTL